MTASSSLPDTPCLLLDVDLLEANLHAMQAFADRAGKRLRPHAKTHKCSALGRRQIEVGAIGCCVAKVSEAAGLVTAGITEVLITGPVTTPTKIDHLVALLERAPGLMVVVDHPDNIRALEYAVGARRRVLDVLLDLDVGLQRTGVAPAAALAVAGAIRRCPHLRLRGIQAYAGHIQHLPDYAQRRAASLECLRPAASVFRALKAEFAGCDLFSASGTGTFDMDAEVEEVTELQVGSYVCMDAEYRAIGSAGEAERFAVFGPALRVLASVVSVNQAGFVTVDAGLKALYRDGGRPQVWALASTGWEYDWFGDEYGKVTHPPGCAPALGSVLELIPSHCDPTINLFDRWHLVRGGAVVGEWAIDLRGCSQ